MSVCYGLVVRIDASWDRYNWSFWFDFRVIGEGESEDISKMLICSFQTSGDIHSKFSCRILEGGWCCFLPWVVMLKNKIVFSEIIFSFFLSNPCFKPNPVCVVLYLWFCKRQRLKIARWLDSGIQKTQLCFTLSVEGEGSHTLPTNLVKGIQYDITWTIRIRWIIKNLRPHYTL